MITNTTTSFETKQRAYAELERRRAQYASEADYFKALAEERAAEYNAEAGELEGLNCEMCKNKGYFWEVVKSYNYGSYDIERNDCICLNERRMLAARKASGLAELPQHYSFEAYTTECHRKKKVKDSAVAFLNDNGKCFFIGGKSGTGKTHICTAMCKVLLARGKKTHYMLWQDEAVRLNAVVNEKEYGPAISKLQSVEVLYIDDFLKPVAGSVPSAAQVMRAFEIINARYNIGLVTIISSERSITKIIDIDEALGSRIVEMAGKYSFNTDKMENYRLKGKEKLT